MTQYTHAQGPFCAQEGISYIIHAKSIGYESPYRRAGGLSSNYWIFDVRLVLPPEETAGKVTLGVAKLREGVDKRVSREFPLKALVLLLVSRCSLSAHLLRS